MRNAPHKKRRRQDYYLLAPIFRDPGITDEKLCDKVKMDWINNGNKRIKMLSERLTPWVQRIKVSGKAPGGKKFKWYPIERRFDIMSIRDAQQEWRKVVEHNE